MWLDSRGLYKPYESSFEENIYKINDSHGIKTALKFFAGLFYYLEHPSMIIDQILLRLLAGFGVERKFQRESGWGNWINFTRRTKRELRPVKISLMGIIHG